MEDEILNADNDVQEDVAESQPAGEEEQKQEGIDLETQQAEKPDAKKDKTKEYSERLNRDREAIRKEYEKQYAPQTQKMQELEIELQALKAGKTVEEVRAERDEQERSRQELLRNDPYVQGLQQQVLEQQENRLLSYLQEQFPDDNVAELSDDFKNLMMASGGRIDPAAVYRAIRDTEAAAKPAVKKELPGSAKSDGQAISKEFYTRDEVEAMSVDEVNKNYDAVMASQKKWK